MPIPPSILIRQEDNSPTAHVGTFGGLFGRKQFLGCVVATLPEGKLPADWGALKRWYAVLHRFDSSGRHLGTEHVFAGTSADGEETVVTRARQELRRLLSALPRARRENIALRLFSTLIDGTEFGLVDASEPEEEYEAIHLVPNDLAFFEPWDGTDDT